MSEEATESAGWMADPNAIMGRPISPEVVAGLEYWRRRKCVLICQDPRIVYGWKGPRCPGCGGRLAHAGDPRPVEEVIQEAGGRLARLVWAAITAPFRHPETSYEDHFCVQCTGSIEPICARKGCLWETSEEVRQAEEKAKESA